MPQFIFNKTVTGKDYVGRQTELNSFRNLLDQGENVAIYEPPKSGKNSFIQQTFFNMKVSGVQFIPINFSLMAIRSIQDLALKFGSAVLGAFGKTPTDHAANVAMFLSDTHFVFDPAVFSAGGGILSANWELDDNDLKAVFGLPYRIAADNSRRMVIVLDEFQNVMLTEDGDKVCHIMEKMFSEVDPADKRWAAFVFSGSMVNAMKDIFARRKLFYRQVNILPLGNIDTKEIIDHAVRCFLASGKVLDRDLMLGVCKLFRNHICYINQFCFICDALSKGYVMEPLLIESLETLLAIHSPRFKAMMFDLTTFQTSLLRAIVDGHTKFSSADIIRRYGLNSSANVRRVKDALCKKEIITFDDNDVPSFLDPLFEYWVKKYYFEIKSE